MILFLIGILNVRAITSNEVTYDNNGVTENLTETIDTLYRELKEYKTNGTVTSLEMLEGSSGYAKGKLINGSIKRKGSTTYTPGVNNQTIKAGQYLNEDQVILGDKNLVAGNIKSGISLFGISGTYTSDANATAAQILSGKTAYVNGSKITGSMKNKSGATVEASNTTSDGTYTYLTIPETGYYDTSSMMKVEKSELINILDDPYDYLINHYVTHQFASSNPTSITAEHDGVVMLAGENVYPVIVSGEGHLLKSGATSHIIFFRKGCNMKLDGTGSRHGTIIYFD